MKLAVTGLGLVTSIGHGVVGSCAALHAGLSRPGPLGGFVVDDGSGEAVPITGYPVASFAEGFFQTGAWVRLASGAFEDLLHAAQPPTRPDFWHRTGLLALTPLVDPDRFGWSLEDLPDALETSYVQPLLSLLEVPIRKENARALALGHCALAGALLQAREMLESRRVDRVLVLAADSYVDPMSLTWLAHHRRLKSPRWPVGLMPGEAGGALLVEAPAAARTREASAIVHVESAVVDGPAEPGSIPARLGRVLADAVKRVLPAHTPHPFRGDLFLDLNGEEWKAQVWGHAQVLLAGQLDLLRCRTVLPADSLGETGAAGAPVALAASAWAFLREHASGEHALVCALSDNGQVSAVLLGHAKASTAVS
ncbi:hypothetical protein [Vitiosangium sp. GDMCC 1.1324]|uniref:hypothetical protein n=1 Tax=Vitiosangium sp. (strain GDMCC 1.1324) TaxID=2138576 RepID=UPI0011B5EFF3|nr:hypothetical protein [Vitiosangium sp. GDMCC 1.1324]